MKFDARSSWLALVPRIPTIAAALLVLAFYAFIGSTGTLSFRRVPWDREFPGFTEGYYARLAESFLRGRTDLNFPPDERWTKVVNAYDFESRKAQGLEWARWDATFYGGKFYLYFSPVPVVLFYLPFRLVARAYPPDAFVATLACAWAFLAGVAFARRALGGRRPWVPFPIWVLLIGLGNVVPFVLADVRAYEVAIATGMALTATWAVALLRFLESPDPRRALWMGVWLALAMATRPNLIVLGLVALWVLSRVKERRVRIACFALVPIVVAGAAMAAYNYARFGSAFELGITYQISFLPMWRVALCRVCDGPEAIRFVNNVVHYVFWSPRFEHVFPFVDLNRSHLDAAVSFTGGAEYIGGVGALSPLTLIGSLCALVLALHRGSKETGVRAAMAMAVASWLVLGALSTCYWVTARYSLDFMLLMTIASVVCIESALTMLERAGVRVRVLSSVAIALVVYAVAVGALLPFRGPHAEKLGSELSSFFSVRGR